jgi:thiamine-phosphate pyrophosphorylase
VAEPPADLPASPPPNRARRTSPLAERRLYLCTPDRPDLERFVSACVTGGVDVVQLRDHALTARALLARGRVALAVCRDHGVPFILNDRPDLALELGADGVHVGQDDAPPALARRIVGDGAIVGYSTHAEAEIDRALGEPVDYVSAGPVVPTPTKPGRPGTGLAYVRAATERSDLPVFVTGSVTPDSVPGLAAAGARHFVVVRWLTQAGDPQGAAQALRHAIDDALVAAEADPATPRR